MDAELYQQDGNFESPRIAEQNGSSIYEDLLTPPFVADAVKMAALYHVGRIRELSREDKSSSQVSIYHNAQNTSEEDRLLRLRMVRGMLMVDMSQLFQRIQVLEQILIEKKTLAKARQTSIAKWMGMGAGVGIGIMALTKPFDPRNPETKLLLKTVLFFLNTYTVYEFYSLHEIEKEVSYTKHVREGLLGLADRVRREALLEDEDVEFLEGEAWNKVPWKEVEGFEEYL